MPTPTTHNAIMLNDREYGNNFQGGGGDGTSPLYEYEESPILKAHAVGDKIFYNDVAYTVTVAMTVPGTTEIIPSGTGKNVNADEIAEGVLVSVIGMPDSGGGGGSATVLKTYYVGETTTTSVPENTIIYYIDTFKKVIKSGGLPANYTIVPNTDLADAGLSTDTLVTVTGIPSTGTIQAEDVAFDDTAAQLGATNVQGAISQLNSNLSELLLGNGAGIHNALYRGKYLGTSVTAEQYAAIADGSFMDMYIGDYWTIGSVNWRIAYFDYWLRTGGTEQTNHHVVIVPDENLYNAQMNTSNVTTGGYIGSAMYTANLASAKATVNSAFGSAHVLGISKVLTNSVSGDIANNWSEVTETVGLMNECMVYGAPINSKPVASSINFNVGYEKTQLALFKLRPELITNRGDWWLRCVVSSAGFAYVHSTGRAGNGSALYSFGVRPAFAIY